MMATTANCELCLKTILTSITKSDDRDLKSTNLLWNYLFHKNIQEPAPNRLNFDQPILSFSFTSSGEGTNSAYLEEKMEFCDDCQINLEKLNNLHEQLETAKKSVRLQVQKINNIQLISQMKAGNDNDEVEDGLLESWRKNGQMTGMSMTGSTAGNANILKTLNFLTSLCDGMGNPPPVTIPPQPSAQSSSKTRRTFASDVPTPLPRQFIPNTIERTKTVQETETISSPQVSASTSAAKVLSSSEVIVANNDVSEPSFSALPDKIDNDNVQMTVDEETDIFLSPVPKLEATDPDEIDAIFSTPHVIMSSEILENPNLNFSTDRLFNYATGTSSDFLEKDPLATDNDIEFSCPEPSLPAPLPPSSSRLPLPRPSTISKITAKSKTKIQRKEELKKPCSVCGKNISSKNISTHMRVHTGLKPYQCDICNKAFSVGNSFKRHYRIHTGEKPYGCNICGEHFITSNSLKSHKKKKHNKL